MNCSQAFSPIPFASVHTGGDFHVLSFLTVLLAFSHVALLCGDPKVLPLVKCLVTHIILLEEVLGLGQQQKCSQGQQRPFPLFNSAFYLGLNDRRRCSSNYFPLGPTQATLQQFLCSPAQAL